MGREAAWPRSTSRPRSLGPSNPNPDPKPKPNPSPSPNPNPSPSPSPKPPNQARTLTGEERDILSKADALAKVYHRARTPE